MLLKSICDANGLMQIVREPTREDYLLDLCLTDIDSCKLDVISSIADHRGILCTVQMPCPAKKSVTREVWHFRNAAWQNLRCKLKANDWSFLKNGSVDEAFLIYSCRGCIRRDESTSPAASSDPSSARIHG